MEARQLSDAIDALDHAKVKADQAQTALDHAESECAQAREQIELALAERGWIHWGVVGGLDLWQHPTISDRTFSFDEAVAHEGAVAA